MAVKYGIKVFQCDVCGHRWLPEGDKVPDQCPSRTCRSRRWNDSYTPTVVAQAIQEALPAVKPASSLPQMPSAATLKPPAMIPRCPTHRLPLVRNDETGIWSCRVTKCRQRADDEAVKLAYETADFASS